MKLEIGNRKSEIAFLLLALLAAGAPASAAEPRKAVTLPDVRAIARERGKAVVRVETVEHFVPGLVRRSVRLANPFPLTSNVGDAFSFVLYLPSAVFYTMRKHLGSGVIIDSEGHVLTNHHVIKRADRVAVRLTDAEGVQRRFEARVVGRDPHTDVALVKFDPGEAKLVTAPLGDSDQVALGDWVIAIGNPFHLTGTVTCGVVSGLHRQVRANLIEDYIQVDAAVNPGNSGGPILNTRGEVIGLVDLGIFPANNIGFAIPTSLIAPFLEDMKKHGQPRRGHLGVSLRDLTPELAEERGLAAQAGVLVAGVSLFSPAARAGLRSGDVIEAVGGQKAEGAREVQMAVLRTPPDSLLPLSVRRGEKTLELRARLAPRRTPFRVF
mgnify:CR=1 FL=1